MKKIGIIDDDGDSNLFLLALLDDKYHVEAYEEWEKGLNALEKEPPELIFLDISMPGATGTEVLKTIRENPHLKGVSVIALTGYALPEDREKYLKLGFDEYLAKPITDIKFFYNLIEKVINSRGTIK